MQKSQCPFGLGFLFSGLLCVSKKDDGFSSKRRRGVSNQSNFLVKWPLVAYFITFCWHLFSQLQHQRTCFGLSEAYGFFCPPYGYNSQIFTPRKLFTWSHACSHHDSLFHLIHVLFVVSRTLCLGLFIHYVLRCFFHWLVYDCFPDVIHFYILLYRTFVFLFLQVHQVSFQISIYCTSRTHTPSIHL